MYPQIKYNGRGQNGFESAMGSVSCNWTRIRGKIGQIRAENTKKVRNLSMTPSAIRLPDGSMLTPIDMLVEWYPHNYLSDKGCILKITDQKKSVSSSIAGIVLFTVFMCGNTRASESQAYIRLFTQDIVSCSAIICVLWQFPIYGRTNTHVVRLLSCPDFFTELMSEAKTSEKRTSGIREY
jgi:hypothetical protein